MAGMRTLLSLAALTVLAAPAYAQEAARNAERLSFGFFAGPAIDGNDPWFFTGIRVSMPAGRRISLDLESSAIHGAESEFARFHGYAAAKLRFQKSPEARSSRYWITGLGVMPGDKLHPDGSVRDQRWFPVIVLGIGQRDLIAGRTRLSTEVEFHGGDGLGLLVSASLQVGARHRLEGK